MVSGVGRWQYKRVEFCMGKALKEGISATRRTGKDNCNKGVSH